MTRDVMCAVAARTCVVAASFAAVSCSAGRREDAGQDAAEAVGSQGGAIVNGTPATAFPEAVLVTAGFSPCSGVLLAPRIVLTAGHCRAAGTPYTVLAPNAPRGPGGKPQQASGSRDWTTYTGSAATSSDTLLVFLDAPIQLDAYPVIAEGEVAAGTSVVDVGRTLNGTITLTDDYVSATVSLGGSGKALGFPYNYEATPDLSQGGDSGGPIELAGQPASAPHTVVAIVDTDTVEQMLDAATPIDLFARLDGVRAQIEEQIEEYGDGGAPDAGSEAGADAGSDAGSGSGSGSGPASGSGSGGGCGVGGAGGRGAGAWSGLVALMGWRRRRRGSPGEVPSERSAVSHSAG